MCVILSHLPRALYLVVAELGLETQVGLTLRPLLFPFAKRPISPSTDFSSSLQVRPAEATVLKACVGPPGICGM